MYTYALRPFLLAFLCLHKQEEGIFITIFVFQECYMAQKQIKILMDASNGKEVQEVLLETVVLFGEALEVKEVLVVEVSDSSFCLFQLRCHQLAISSTHGPHPAQCQPLNFQTEKHLLELESGIFTSYIIKIHKSLSILVKSVCIDDFVPPRLKLHNLTDTNKGQIISEYVFGVFNFFQITNENKST